MINEEKVSYMTKMAAFETREGKKCQPMRKYFRKDYISLQMIKSFFYGTAACVVVLAAYCVCQADDLMARIDSLNYSKIGAELLKGYLLFMFLYFALTYAVYSVRYVKGCRKLRRYERYLKQVQRFYRKECRIEEKNIQAEKTK